MIWQQNGKPPGRVGGDFYDVFELSSGKFGLIIADVSDKGLPASLYMTVSRTLIRAMALDNESPARTLRKGQSHSAARFE